MAIDSYLTLKQALKDWSKRSDSYGQIETFIALCEADLWESLRIRDMETRATSSASSRFLALPAGFLEMRKLRVYSGNESHELAYSTPESMNVSNTSGILETYTINSQIEFERPPSGTVTAEMHYFKKLTPLSNSNLSNAILERFPKIYLYGSLFHLYQWAKDDAETVKYEALFVSAMNSANKSDRKSRYGKAKAMRFEGVVA